MKNNYILIILVLWLFSCDDPFSTTLEIDPPAFHDMAVVIAESAHTNTSFSLTLKTTTPIIPYTEDPYLNDASVEVLENRHAYFTMKNQGNNQGSPNYTYTSASTLFKENKEYSLEINSAKYGLITAKSTLPPRVTPESMVLEEDGGLNLTGEDRSAIKVVINDPPDQENFYEAWVTRTYENENSYDGTYTEVNDPNFFRNINYDSVVFSDFTFNGERKSISLLFYPINCCGRTEKFKLHWRNITEEFYEFSRSVEAQDLVEDNPFASPVQVPNFIENGLGIFSLYNEYSFDVE